MLEVCNGHIPWGSRGRRTLILFISLCPASALSLLHLQTLPDQQMGEGQRQGGAGRSAQDALQTATGSHDGWSHCLLPTCSQREKHF